MGADALRNNTGGDSNTAVGHGALRNSTTGFGNTALGVSAGLNITTANNVIAIGIPGGNVSYTCFIGNTFGVQTQNGNALPVVIDSAGQLGTASSSAKFKKEIKPMEKASEAIWALEPVTFFYERDKTGTVQFGLIAEDVAKVSPDLVVRDKNGEIYTVRYDAVNAMLLNEFLKEHKRVEELNCRLAEQEAIVALQKQGFHATIARQDNEIRALIATVKEQAAQIQKVSAQIEASKAPLHLTAAETP